jgi:hypothetical protein
MPVKLFLWTLGKAMRPDHVYRLTVVYENPEPRTIADGGMGVLGGVVMLSRGSRWPTVDPRDPEYVVDVHTTIEESDWPSHDCGGHAHHHAAQPAAVGGATPPAGRPSDPHASRAAPGCSSPTARP